MASRRTLEANALLVYRGFLWLYPAQFREEYASASSVRGLVLRQGMTLVGSGLVIGILAALALTRLLKTLLYEISPMDPVTYVPAPMVLIAVALAAYLPTRRAIRVDPVVALRHD